MMELALIHSPNYRFECALYLIVGISKQKGERDKGKANANANVNLAFNKTSQMPFDLLLLVAFLLALFLF